MLKPLRRSKATKVTARRLCAELMAQARAPVFFTRLGVPDTMDGRFDLVALHAWLALEQIESEPVLAQALVNEIFLQFDEALRDLGTGDVGMNRRLKTMASAFYGRLQAYRSASTPEELAQAIRRNLFRGAPGRQGEIEALATYAMNSRSHLAKLNDGGSGLKFGPLPDM
jgi:cytochrome b pre-mRNA-processing protein 3